MSHFSFTLAGIFFLLLQVSVSVHILLHKDDVPSAIGWMGLVWLAPILGSILYILFGINRIRRKARRLHGRKHSSPPRGENRTDERQHLSPSLRQLLHLGYQIHPQAFTTANRLTPLKNGDEAYPRMCAAIAAARREVLLASYIFNNDAAGQQFAAALKTAAAHGARVRVLVDGVGLHYSRPDIAHALRDVAEIEFSVFLPSRSPITLPFVNLRNHRKLMIIDGEIAFFGGMNIAQGNLVAANPKDPIQDITFEIRGPVIEQIEQLFEEDWVFSGKKPFRAAAPQHAAAQRTQQPPQTPPAKQTPARIIPDGPDGDYGKFERLCLGALCCAQKSIRIVTPYFLPGNEILTALETAAGRGVTVEIILPQKSNIFGMDWAMRANFPRLLKNGVHIYRARPPFDHSKLFLVDDIWLLAGSANWDQRSFKLNFESNIECFDSALAKQVAAIIRRKKENAAALSPAQKIPLLHTLAANLFRLLTPYY